MNTLNKPLAGTLLAGVLALGMAAPVVVAEKPGSTAGAQVSLGNSKSKPQADRWGLFCVGEWTPTFFAIRAAAADDPVDRDKHSEIFMMISTIQNLGVRSEHAYAASAEVQSTRGGEASGVAGTGR